MILYEVSVNIRIDLSEQFERYMREKHIPEILATKCFEEIRFDKVNPGHYRTCYQASSTANYERYINEFASAMRADFMAHFPEDCVPSRLVYETLQSWAN
nr:DUF4286 family protein [uncultured Undibacterium sp.]